MMTDLEYPKQGKQPGYLVCNVCGEDKDVNYFIPGTRVRCSTIFGRELMTCSVCLMKIQEEADRNSVGVGI